jgi:hypothetical protein
LLPVRQAQKGLGTEGIVLFPEPEGPKQEEKVFFVFSFLIYFIFNKNLALGLEEYPNKYRSERRPGGMHYGRRQPIFVHWIFGGACSGKAK